MSIDYPSRLRAMADFSPEASTVTKLIPEGAKFLRETAAHVIKIELALHQIAGHGNITGERARQIASEALGIKVPG